MDTQNTRVTRAQAAKHAGVSVRQISRYRAAGLLADVRYAPIGSREPATYNLAEVLRAKERWDAGVVDVPLPETDMAALANPETGGTVVS